MFFSWTFPLSLYTISYGQNNLCYANIQTYGERKEEEEVTYIREEKETEKGLFDCLTD